MRGRSREPIIRAVALLALLCLAGCYYRKYDALVRTHVELVLAMADKRTDYADQGAPPPNSAEFTYPVERARDFARIVGDRFGEKASYRELLAFLDRYEKLLARVESMGEEARGKELEELRAQGQVVKAALDREAG